MAIAGKKGKLVIDTDESRVLGIKNWSLALNINTLETTGLGDDWKSYITGLKEWTASSSGDYEIKGGAELKGQDALQEAFLNGTSVSLKLFVDGEHYYAGSAYIASLSIEDPVDDVVTISIEFTGSGELTFS